MSWTAIEDAIHTWVVAGSGLDAAKVIWAEQGGPRPAVPYIALQLASETVVGQDWLDVSDNPLVVADDDVESVDAGADELTLTAHGLLSGDGPLRFTTTGTLPAGMALATDYWAIKTGADTVQVATTYVHSINATQVDLTDTGSGTHTLSDTSETERSGIEIEHTSRGQRVGTLAIQCYAEDATGAARAGAILRNVVGAVRLSTAASALRAAGVGVAAFEPVTVISGAFGQTQWEPRAVTSVRFFMVSEVSEYTTYIETAEVSEDI